MTLLWADKFDLDESKIYEIDLSADMGTGDNFSAAVWRAPDAEAAGFSLSDETEADATVARVRITFPSATATNKAEQYGKTYEVEAAVTTDSADVLVATALLKIEEASAEDLTTLLVVEDGTSKSDANSYATVAEWDAYMLSVGDERARNLSKREKEQRLIRATMHLDNTFRYRFLGLKTKTTQALEHPRQALYDHEGVELATDEVQIGIKRATFELAALSEIVSAQSKKSDFISEVSATTGTHVKFKKQAPSRPIPRRAALHLSGLIGAISSNARLERMS